VGDLLQGVLNLVPELAGPVHREVERPLADLEAGHQLLNGFRGRGEAGSALFRILHMAGHLAGKIMDHGHVVMDLTVGGAQFLHGGGDLEQGFAGLAKVLHHVFKLVGGPVHHFPGLADVRADFVVFRPGVAHQVDHAGDVAGNFFRGLVHPFRQFAHLVRHHGKAPSSFPGPSCLNGGVQGQQIGLVRDGPDQGRNGVHAGGALGQVIHRVVEAQHLFIHRIDFARHLLHFLEGLAGHGQIGGGGIGNGVGAGAHFFDGPGGFAAGGEYLICQIPLFPGAGGAGLHPHFDVHRLPGDDHGHLADFADDLAHFFGETVVAFR